MLTLYTYYRSSASYRVRIALALKGLEARHVPINLLKGEQNGSAFAALNPQCLVPAMVVEEEGALFTQSQAIIDYLEERFPTPALLPARAKDKARVRAIAQAIGCDISPLNNRRVLLYLTEVLGVDEEAKTRWIHHWMGLGLAAVEAVLQDGASGRFCHGDTPGLADCFLIPQVYGAERFGVPLEAYPTIRRIAEECAKLAAFQAAHPDAQADKPL